MTPSPDAAPEYTSPPANLGYTYQQQRAHTKPLDNLQSRGRHSSRHELGRRDRYGERATRIYPRQIAKSPATANRYSSASPHAPQTYNATTSPLLSALGTTKSTATQYTSEWTKSLPFFINQQSPNNGIAIAGSPPPLPPLYNSPGTREGVHNQAAMSNSPPAPGVRPLSHPNHYTSFGGRLQTSPNDSPGRDRRASMYSHYGAKPFATNPPLPHQPQAHYYNLHDIDLGLNPTADSGIHPGEGGYFCGLDTLSMAGDDPSKVAENVLLVGYEGGIDVFRVEKAKMDLVGRLEGLKGSVLGAKIIPWTSRRDPLLDCRPLIALVIHGPVINKGKDGPTTSSSSSVIDDSSSQSPSRPASSRGGNEPADLITHYQTTVEVYSLKRKELVAVLYKSPLIPLTTPLDSPLYEPPPPTGDFVVDAKGKFVVVASGSSGEVFIFAPYLGLHADHHEQFRCIGKVWTSVQFRERGSHSSSSSAVDGNSREDAASEKYGIPVFSISDRWLAVTPPSSTTLFPVNGTALTSETYPRPPGLAHHTVPPQPSATCAVDIPETDSFLNRLTREGTQVAIKGARWATEKGIQAFKNYMGKTGQPNGNTNGGLYGDPMQQPQYFPPTHAHGQAQPRAEGTVISLYDLQKMFDAEELKNKNALHPIATIPASLGCSYLSFSPSGLMLMTVSRKGDFQDVWDLKRVNFRRPRKSNRDIPSGPHVRQVARFARMTVTNVVDVIWSAPRIDRLAVLTDKGTVHMYSMPSSAFQWPPPRRSKRSAPVAKQEETPPSGGRGSAVNSAMQAINGTAKPFLDAVRIRNNSAGGSLFPSFSSLGMAPVAGAKSGKAVAAGVGKSINNIRHARDNKLTMPSSPSGVKPNSIRWMTGKTRGCIGLVAGGVLQIYRVQMRPGTGKGRSKPATSITKKKMVEFGLTPIPDTALPPSIAAQLYAQPGEPAPPQTIHGEWLPRALPSKRNRPGLNGTKFTAPAPLSFSEIETNPPYQPSYTDRRVTRFTFSRNLPSIQQSTSEWQSQRQALLLISNLHHQTEDADDYDDSAWLFGEDVDATRISSPAAQMYDGGDFVAGDEDLGEAAARVENLFVQRDGGEEVETVVVTTRRRRVRRGEGENGEGEEGFFEDDCDVLDFAEDRV